jgi:hypothetical protein
MLEAVGRAVRTLLAIALGAEALLTLRPLRARLNTRTLAWRVVAPILAVLVLAQVIPAMRLAHRAGDAAVAAVASADPLAVGQITLLRLTLDSRKLTRTLRTFGSELHPWAVARQSPKAALYGELRSRTRSVVDGSSFSCCSCGGGGGAGACMPKSPRLLRNGRPMRTLTGAGTGARDLVLRLLADILSSPVVVVNAAVIAPSIILHLRVATGSQQMTA